MRWLEVRFCVRMESREASEGMMACVQIGVRVGSVDACERCLS